MKRKFSLGWRVAVALVLVASLGMVFATPAAAVGGRYLGVDYPHTVFVCEEFDVVAEVYVDKYGSPINDAVVRITLPNDEPKAILLNESDDLVAEHWVGDVCCGKYKETTFRLKCIEPGRVYRGLVELFEAGNPSDILRHKHLYIYQKCKLDVDIRTPSDSTKFRVGEQFAVTADVTNKTDATLGDVEVGDVEVCLEIDGNADIVGGDYCYSVGLIAPNTTQEVNWTVECLDLGDVDLTVSASADGVECVAECSETIEVHQVVPCLVEIELDDIPVGEICECEDFTVSGTIYNRGYYDATNVGVELFVTDGTATIKPTNPLGPFDIDSCHSQYVEWTVHCDGRTDDPLLLCDDPDPVSFRADVDYDCHEGTYQATDSLVEYAEQKWLILEIDHPIDCTNFCVGTEFDVDATITNCYEEDVQGNVTITFDPPTGVFALDASTPSPQTNITVPANSSVTLSTLVSPWYEFHVRCLGPGDGTINLRFSGIAPPGEGLTLCDDDEVTVHQQTPASLDVDLDAPDCAKVCEDFIVTATIWNDGDPDAADATDIEATLRVVSGNATIKSTNPVTGLGPLGPKSGDPPAEDIVVTWEVHCDDWEDAVFEVSVIGTDAVCGDGLGPETATDSTIQLDLIAEIVSPRACEDFYVSETFCVTAEISNEDADSPSITVDTATITLVGNAELVEGEDAVKPVGPIAFDDPPQEVSWTVHCTGPGEVDIKVVAHVTEPADCECLEFVDTISVQQEIPELEVEILSPDDSTFVATSQEFAVTARVTNPDRHYKDRIAFDVPVTINPGENASVIGPVPVIPIPDLPLETQIIDQILPGESVLVTWTLHCDKPGDTDIVVTVPEIVELSGEKSLSWISWGELQGYYFSWMYDDTGESLFGYRTFMDNLEMADPNRYNIDNDPDIYRDYLEWEDVGFLWWSQTGIVVEAPAPMSAGTTMYLLAKVIAPEGTELMIRGPWGTAITLIDTMGSFRLYEVKTDDRHGGIEMGDKFFIIPTPSNAGVHIAATWDINYADGYDGYHLPDDWWAWLTTTPRGDGDVGCWDKLDWHVTRYSPSPEVMAAITVHQYPAAHLEVDIDDVYYIYDEVEEEWIELPLDEPIVTCTEFTIKGTITNTGWADATEVYATISVEPEGSVRVAAGEDGYTKYIGTIPGHDSEDNFEEVEWLLHCKVACDSTITITVEGMDEYGLSFTEQTTWYEGEGYIEGHVVGDVHGCAHVNGYIEGWVCAAEMCIVRDDSWLFVAGEFHGEACFDAHVEAFIRGDVYFNGWVNEFTMIEDPFGPIPERFIEPDSITVKQITPAQLVVDISYPANGEEFTEGDDFVVTTTISNIGEETAVGVNLDMVIDGNASVDSAPAGFPQDLAGGEEAVAKWLLQCTDEGFVVISAYAGGFGELTGDATEAFDVVTVKQGEVPYAQLVVDISYPENGDEFIEGDEFPVTATVYNIGEMDAENVTATIDTGDNASTADVLEMDLDDIPSGGSKVASWMVDCDTAGFSIIIVTAVADNANSVVDPVTIKQITPPEPYLTVDLSAPAQIFESEYFTVTAVVSNIGDAEAANVDPYMTASGLVTPTSASPDLDWDIPAGDSRVAEFLFHCEGEGGVNIYVEAYGDNTNTAADSIAVQQIMVPPPEPYLTVELSAPAQIYVNEDYTVTAVVSNIGDADATLVDADMTASGLVTPTSGNVPIGAIAAGDSAVVEFDFTCTGEGGVNIYVEAAGTNTNTAADSAAVQQKPPIPPTLVSIPDASASVGGSIDVPIRITNVIELGGADIWLSHDSTVVEVSDVTAGDLGPVTFSIDKTAGVTKMNWYEAPGKTGDFVFAYVTLQAVGSLGQTSDLDLTVQSLVDTYAEPILHGVDDGVFTILGLMEGDVSMNSHVTISDAMLIAQYLVGLITLSADQLVCADTDDDLSVAISDAMHIAQWLVDAPFEPLWKSPEDDLMLPPVP